jgi:DNA modification methylase
VFNFIETKKNNDAKQELNGATFPSELVAKLLDIYFPKTGGGVVYDPFMGTGTTGYASCAIGVDCYGSEISAAQCEYAKKRIDDMFNQCEIIKGAS